MPNCDQSTVWSSHAASVRLQPGVARAAISRSSSGSGSGRTWQVTMATLTANSRAPRAPDTPRPPSGRTGTGAAWCCFRRPARRSPPGCTAIGRRLVMTTAPTTTSQRTGRDGPPQRVAVEEHRHHSRGDQQRDQVHDLDQRVDRRTGGVLERVTDGVTDDGGVVGLASPCRRGCRPRRTSSRCPRPHRSWPGTPPSGCLWRWCRPGTSRGRRYPGRSPPRSASGWPADPGVLSSRRESRVQMSTTLPYSGFSVPSMIPGCSRNCRRTSKMIAPAARVTALIASPENRNTTEAPISRPTRLRGLETSRMPRYWEASCTPRPCSASPACAVACCTASRKEPNSAVAASTAVAIAMPLVIAFVVLPTASRLVSTCGTLALDVAGHLGDALRVVGDRTEGVHRDDDADRGQQTGTGQRHCEQAQGDRTGTQQERAVHRSADEQRGVHRGLQTQRDTGQDDGRRTGQRGAGHVVDRT